MPNKWYLRETTDALKNISFAKLEKFGDILQEEVENGAPGRIKAVVRRNRIRQQVTIGATHPVSNLIPVFVEYGTAPHVITPKTKEALRWMDNSGTHFSKVVFHPGTSPNPFMRRGISRAIFRAQELRY